MSTENLKKARAWCARQYAKRRRNYEHPSHVADEILREAAERFDLGTFGVEGWSDDSGRKGVSYLNAGDSYAMTIVCLTDVGSCQFRIGCWADFAP